MIAALDDASRHAWRDPGRPEAVSRAQAPPLPAGLALELDGETRLVADGAALLGGRPRRVMRLSPAGQQALRQLLSGSASDPAALALGRRLTEAGLAHPRPSPQPAAGRVTIVIPVRDRAGELRDCLRSLGGEFPVVIVDDGSRDPAEIAAVASAHGAQLMRREQSAGPAAARNVAISRVGTEAVAFLDSDCLPAQGWLQGLLGHLTDPLVVAAAPRVRGARVGGGHEDVRRPCALDMGTRPALVRPGGRVSYVPSAALLVRREAFAGGFDERLRYGEDVDLIWRLAHMGGRVRYDPSLSVLHREPVSLGALMARRFRYGTSAAPLAARHGDACAPAVLPAGRAVALALAIAGRPRAAAVLCAREQLLALRRRRRAGLTHEQATRLALQGELELARAWTRYLSGVLLPVGALTGLAVRRRGLRVALTLMAGAQIGASTLKRGSCAGAALALADGAAYGTGVWWGCLRARSARALLPAIR